jgi:predicted DNA-binding protein (MmcQ/YjbR family)
MCSGVFYHDDNSKCIAIAMNVPRRKSGLDTDESADVINLKRLPDVVESGAEKGTFRSCYLNKLHWLSVTLDGHCEDDLIRWLVDISYTLTSKKASAIRRNITVNKLNKSKV